MGYFWNNDLPAPCLTLCITFLTVQNFFLFMKLEKQISLSVLMQAVFSYGEKSTRGGAGGGSLHNWNRVKICGGGRGLFVCVLLENNVLKIFTFPVSTVIPAFA